MAKTLTLYVDGVKQTIMATDVTGWGKNKPLYVGRAMETANWFGGRVDDVVVFAGALTQPDIEALKQS